MVFPFRRRPHFHDVVSRRLDRRKSGRSFRRLGLPAAVALVRSLLALLFVTITLNLAGAFEFSGVRISSTGQTSGASLGGSFATGILAVVVASPCTAPFMGAA